MRRYWLFKEGKHNLLGGGDYVLLMICFVYSEHKENRAQRIKCHITAVINSTGPIGHGSETIGSEMSPN